MTLDGLNDDFGRGNPAVSTKLSKGFAEVQTNVNQRAFVDFPCKNLNNKCKTATFVSRKL